jgi:hypothetical protein
MRSRLVPSPLRKRFSGSGATMNGDRCVGLGSLQLSQTLSTTRCHGWMPRGNCRRGIRMPAATLIAMATGFRSRPRQARSLRYVSPTLRPRRRRGATTRRAASGRSPTTPARRGPTATTSWVSWSRRRTRSVGPRASSATRGDESRRASTQRRSQAARARGPSAPTTPSAGSSRAWPRPAWSRP